MYKYYSLERPISIGTYPKTPSNPMIGFENFENNNQCVKKEVRDGEKCFKAWGYLLFKQPLSEKEISDYELGDAGSVSRNTHLIDLPRSIQDEILDTINTFYQMNEITPNHFKMNREGFVDVYGNFSLDDVNKMMPRISHKYSFINEKDKNPLEKLMDGNTIYKNVLDNMESELPIEDRVSDDIGKEDILEDDEITMD